MAGYQFSTQPVKVKKIETKHRTIKTEIPCAGTAEFIKEIEKFESRSMHGQLPIIWDRAENFNVYDKAGNKWIDFTSTIFVTNTGHANPHILKRMQQVLDHKLLHTYAYLSQIRLDYLKKLIEMSPPELEKAFLLSAGTETTEAAVKLMRLHGQEITKKKQPGIIAFTGNWHGRTMGAQLLSSNESQKRWIGFRDPHIHHLPFPYEKELKNQDPKEFWKQSLQSLKEKGIDPTTDITGMMLETFQGWGALFYPKAFVQEIRRYCDENNVLLCFDEMQAGFARTGKMFGYEHYGVKADLICVGKGMGGGLPISGVLGKKTVMDLPPIGDMSSTHSANPLVCAGALGVLEEIEGKRLVEETMRKGLILHKRLNEIRTKYPQVISAIHGHGLLAAVHFGTNGQPESALPSHVSERCMQKGLLVVHTGRESIKLAPPLTIDDDALIEGIDVLEQSIGECLHERN
jgi:4-aminobutyrate aminotransferase/(S)-3-amino-2-methylpropionate transaminase